MVSKGHLCFYSFCFKGRSYGLVCQKNVKLTFFCKCNFRIFAKLANVQKKRAPICLADLLIYTFAIFYQSQMQYTSIANFPLNTWSLEFVKWWVTKISKRMFAVADIPHRSFELSHVKPSQAEKGSESSRAKLGHFNFWAETKLTIFLH